MLLALLKTLRPKQWIKNVFVIAPLVFAQRMFDLPSVLLTAAAFGLFSLVAGCVYVVNDLVDVEKDRAHPQKCNRPIPSGRLPTSVAKAFVGVAVPLAVGLAALVSLPLAAVLAGYFALNLAYSLKLKNVAYLDVLSIAAGFVLRVVGGAFAIAVAPSAWLIGCTASLAMMLGFGKRAHELASQGMEGKTRDALSNYSLEHLSWILNTLSLITISIYVLYTQSEHARATFGALPLVYTIPFPIVGIVRFHYLVTNRPDAESPTEEMLRDPLFIANVVGWVIAILAVVNGVVL